MSMLAALLTSFGTALLAPLLHHLIPRRAGWLWGLPPLALFCFFLARTGPAASGAVQQESYAWIPSLGVTCTLVMDSLSILFALLISGIGVIVLIYASSYLRHHRHLGRFYGLILAFMAAMLGTVLAGDLLTLFTFWELTGFCSFMLIGFEHENRASRDAALQALLVTGAGGLALLAGIVLMGRAAGSMDLKTILASGDVLRAHPHYLAMLLLILSGAFTKSAQFPFHFWLPGAMAAPTPVSAYLHSATMVKLGIYLLARLAPVVGGTKEWFVCLTLVGVTTMLLGGATAIFRDDLKQILAWSTVSALGTLTLLLGLGTPLAVTTAMLLLPVHALYKSALFLAAGAVDHAVGSRAISRLGGLAGSIPWLAAGALMAALSMAGLPPLAGFIAKELLYETTLQAPLWPMLTTAFMTAANALAIVAALMAGYAPFFGRRKEPGPPPHRVEAHLWLPVLVPALAGLLIGLFPAPFGHWLVAPAVEKTLATPVPVALALWHGINPPLVLSLVTLVAGLAIAVGRIPLINRLPSLNGTKLWGPEQLYARILEGLPRLAAVLTASLQNGRLRHYLMTVVGGAVGLMCLALISGSASLPTPQRPDGGLHEWLTAAVILGGALMAATTRSRLAAVAALGTVGYGVALIYIIFGAPDLAMTQFCIETLSIIMFVLVLYRLPRFTPLSSPLSRLRDLLVSLSIGCAMGLLVLMAVSRPMFPHIGDWFLRQSLPAGHGRNVVNVILVDFRALDTLGEITVLAVAALGVYGLLKKRSGEDS